MVVKVRKYKRKDGTKVVSHTRSDAEAHNDLKFKAGDEVKQKSSGKASGAGLKEMASGKSRVEPLEARYDSAKSFYGKATVETKSNGDKVLTSYNTQVAEVRGGKPVLLGIWSQTTTRHQKEFLRQYAGVDEAEFKRLKKELDKKKDSSVNQYKLWAKIEEIFEANDEYVDISDDVLIGTFATKDEAFEELDGLFVNRNIIDIADDVKKYTLWATVEEFDAVKENYEDIGEPVPIGTFATKDEAFEELDELFISRSGLD